MKTRQCRRIDATLLRRTRAIMSAKRARNRSLCLCTCHERHARDWRNAFVRATQYLSTHSPRAAVSARLSRCASAVWPWAFSSARRRRDAMLAPRQSCQPTGLSILASNLREILGAPSQQRAAHAVPIELLLRAAAPGAACDRCSRTTRGAAHAAEAPGAEAARPHSPPAMLARGPPGGDGLARAAAHGSIARRDPAPSGGTPRACR